MAFRIFESVAKVVEPLLCSILRFALDKPLACSYLVGLEEKTSRWNRKYETKLHLKVDHFSAPGTIADIASGPILSIH
jgi:hypothetical protein